MHYSNVTLLIFSRAPTPGDCKTRLIPELGPHGAAQLHSKLTLHTLDTFLQPPVCQTQLWCAPDDNHPFFKQCRNNYALTLHHQPAGDLGAKMAFAVQCSLKHKPHVVIIGTDCPALTTRHLQEVIGDLENGYDASIIPADDGGYVLIGLNKFDDFLFNGIKWGSNQVMDQTTRRLNHLGWIWRAHMPLWDVDRAADITRMNQAGFLL